jgi:hypothetical protein
LLHSHETPLFSVAPALLCVPLRSARPLHFGVSTALDLRVMNDVYLIGKVAGRGPRARVEFVLQRMMQLLVGRLTALSGAKV